MVNHVKLLQRVMENVSSLQWRKPTAMGSQEGEDRDCVLVGIESFGNSKKLYTYYWLKEKTGVANGYVLFCSLTAHG